MMRCFFIGSCNVQGICLLRAPGFLVALCLFNALLAQGFHLFGCPAVDSALAAYPGLFTSALKGKKAVVAQVVGPDVQRRL